ncbi:MAG: DUF4407 domain-containing protein [Bacteroidia bacterium]
MKRIGLLTQFLCSCAGCDIATLRQCNSAEQRKKAIIGSCVLITPILGFASGTFAILTFSENLPLSLGFGFLWGFVIFMIERAIVANTQPGVINLGVIARLLLATIFAVVIAVPMELKVFEDAIQEKLSDNLSNKVALIDADFDVKIAGLNDKINTSAAKVEALRLSYIGEVDGTSGSGKANKGPIAREKERLWKAAESDAKIYTSAKNTEIAALNLQRKEKITQITKAQAEGFLGRMRALGTLSKEDNTVFWGIWLLRLFFLSIELVPISIKLSSGKDGDTYHEIVKQNGATAVSVNQQTEQVRAELMVKQQRAFVNAELLKLQFTEMSSIMQDAQKRFDFFMGQLKRASDHKLQVQFQIFKTVKDEGFRNHLLDQVEDIYLDFEKALRRLMDKKDPSSDYISDLS